MSVRRRAFLRGAGVAGAAAIIPAPPSDAQAPPAPAAEPVPIHLFFTEAEAAFVRAAVDRLIPPDENWAGAAEAGVVDYIDRQLAGAYGNGAGMYLAGPWARGTPEQGYQLPLTPAELYRRAIPQLAEHVAAQHGGKAFAELAPEIQDQVLKALESGEVGPEAVLGAVFFETLLANTIEGFFADPIYGGNRDMVGWRMVGFPGAYGQFAYLVEDHGRHFDQPPVSMAHNAHHHADR